MTASDQDDPDSTPGNANSLSEDDDDSFELDVTPEADLELTKTYPAGSYENGDNVTFTLTVTNVRAGYNNRR